MPLDLGQSFSNRRGENVGEIAGVVREELYLKGRARARSSPTELGEPRHPVEEAGNSRQCRVPGDTDGGGEENTVGGSKVVTVEAVEGQIQGQAPPVGVAGKDERTVVSRDLDQVFVGDSHRSPPILDLGLSEGQRRGAVARQTKPHQW